MVWEVRRQKGWHHSMQVVSTSTKTVGSFVYQQAFCHNATQIISTSSSIYGRTFCASLPYSFATTRSQTFDVFRLLPSATGTCFAADRKFPTCRPRCRTRTRILSSSTLERLVISRTWFDFHPAVIIWKSLLRPLQTC